VEAVYSPLLHRRKRVRVEVGCDLKTAVPEDGLERGQVFSLRKQQRRGAVP
jgi:hypothetical protein